MTSSGSVPLVDFSLEETELAKQLTSALTTVGFACLTNTGIWDKAREFAAHSKSFFSQDREYKSQFMRPTGSVTDNVGWVPVGVERLSDKRPADYKEFFNMMTIAKGNSQRQPPELDNSMCWVLWDDFTTLSHKVLRVIGLGLGLKNPNALSEAHHISDPKTNRSALRLAWYPRIEPDKVEVGQIRCGEHSDYGSITLLYSDSPGLQVINRTTGQYEDSGYVEGGIFVNIGDLLQMWSGDTLLANEHVREETIPSHNISAGCNSSRYNKKYRRHRELPALAHTDKKRSRPTNTVPKEHRVLIPNKESLNRERTSIAFFCQPDNDALIETLDGSGKYPPVTSQRWLESRFAATY